MGAAPEEAEFCVAEPAAVTTGESYVKRRSADPTIVATVAYASRVVPIPAEVPQDRAESVTQLRDRQAVEPSWIDGDKKLVPKLSPESVSGVEPDVAPLRTEREVRTGAS